MQCYTQFPSRNNLLPAKLQEYIRDRYLDIICRYFHGLAIPQFITQTWATCGGVIVQDHTNDLYIMGANNEDARLVLSVKYKYEAQQELNDLRAFATKLWDEAVYPFMEEVYGNAEKTCVRAN